MYPSHREWFGRRARDENLSGLYMEDIMFVRIFEGFAQLRRVPLKFVALTALASWFLCVGAILQGQPLYIIALFTLLPWLPLVAFEGIWKYEHYSWTAVFAVITILQVGHITEHSFQIVQLEFLGGTVNQACPPPVDNVENSQRAVQAGLRPANVAPTGGSAAVLLLPEGKASAAPKLVNGQPVRGIPGCGVFGQLDFETVHLVWDTLVWIGALALLVKFPGNIWLWIAMIAASAHEIEHLFIGYVFFFDSKQLFPFVRQLWATTVNGNIVTAQPGGIVNEFTNFYEAGGKIGILGQNGLVANFFPPLSGAPFGADGIGKWLPLPRRPYLHFGYNSLVVIPTVIAFLVQLRQAYDRYLEIALPGLTQEDYVRLTTNSKHERYRPGDVIIKQGDPAHAFYIIANGRVDVVRRKPDGEEGVVSHLSQGDFFGEVGLLHGGKNVTSVRASTDVEVLVLDRDTFKEMVKKSSMSQQELERVVKMRVRELQSFQGN